MSETIGGFIGLEDAIEGQPWYSGTCLSTGRSCLTHILKQMGATKVWLPYYTCDALYEPVQHLGIPFEYYAINNAFEIEDLPQLESKEVLIYVDYFGIKSDYAQKLASGSEKQLIIDATQAFFNVPDKVRSFVSMRKFFGLPDGAYCFTPDAVEIATERSAELDTEYLELRSKGNNTKAYQGFLANEKALSWQVLDATGFTQAKAASIDYQNSIERRRNNFISLHRTLANKNSLNLRLTPEEVPLCYPFLPEKAVDRAKLHKNGFFIPTYWNDVVTRGVKGFDLEVDLSKRLLPLPVDQRYGSRQMARMAKYVLGLI